MDKPSPDDSPIYTSERIKRSETVKRRAKKAVGVGEHTHTPNTHTASPRGVSVGSTRKKVVGLSRYSRKAIRRYVDSQEDVRNPGGLTQTLWLSGDADQDVADYLRYDEGWQETASKQGIQLVLKYFPHWTTSEAFKSWESKITATVVSHFNLWEAAIQQYFKANPFPMDVVLEHYLMLISEEMSGGAESAA